MCQFQVYSKVIQLRIYILFQILSDYRLLQDIEFPVLQLCIYKIYSSLLGYLFYIQQCAHVHSKLLISAPHFGNHKFVFSVYEYMMYSFFFFFKDKRLLSSQPDNSPFSGYRPSDLTFSSTLLFSSLWKKHRSFGFPSIHPSLPSETLLLSSLKACPRLITISLFYFPSFFSPPFAPQGLLY